MDVRVLDGAKCEVSEVKQWQVPLGPWRTMLRLNYRGLRVFGTVRKSLRGGRVCWDLQISFPGLGERENGHRVEVELGTHWENRPLDAVL